MPGKEVRSNGAGAGVALNVCVTDALYVIYGCTFILLSLMWAQLLPAYKR